MVVKNVKNHQQWDLKDPQIIYIYIYIWLIVYDIYTRTLHAPIRSFSAHREVLEPPRPGSSLDHPDPTGEVPARSQPGEEDSRAQAAGRASAVKGPSF